MPSKIIVHAGVFHADDVLCVALTKALYPEIKVERKFKVTDEEIENKDILICDIAGQYSVENRVFDHHNSCPDIPGTAIKSASIGLLMRFLNIEVEDPFMSALITIQARDNGDFDAATDELGQLVAILARSFNPLWDDDINADDAFMNSVNFMIEHFVIPMMRNGDLDPHIPAMKEKLSELQERSAAAKERATIIVNSALSEMVDGIVILPQFCPWQGIVAPSEGKFVIYPSNRGGYNLQAVPVDVSSIGVLKIELDWGETIPEGMTFVHPAKFLASFESQAQAVEAAKILINSSRKERG